MILSYQSIKKRCIHAKLLDPWSEQEVAHGMSYGLGPAGYDIRQTSNELLYNGDFLLVSSVEEFNMPDDLIAQVCDKSTWARRGLLVQNTVIEPGWRGILTLELTCHSLEPIQLRPGCPIAQILFVELDSPTQKPYRGKYQDQSAEPQGPILT